MEYIKEPKGIDLNLSPLPLSKEDQEKVSAIIAQYKDSGKKPKSTQSSNVPKNKKLAKSSSSNNNPKGKANSKK